MMNKATGERRGARGQAGEAINNQWIRHQGPRRIEASTSAQRRQRLSPSRRDWLVGLLAGSIAYAALIQVAASQGGPPRVINVRIEHRKVVSPKRAIRVRQNDVIELRWTSDELVKLHLHGYDRQLRVRPGRSAVMVVRAHATGRFPITSHGWGHSGHGHHALTYLEVYPR